jgi:hypothetical protein
VNTMRWSAPALAGLRAASARTRHRSAAILVAAALALGMSGCALAHGQKPPTVTMALARPEACALVVIFDRDSATARSEFRSLVTTTARAGEHLIVIDADTGRELGSFLAPPGPVMVTPTPPPPLPHDPTSFLRHKHGEAVAAYEANVRRDQAMLRASARRRLASWAAMVVSRVEGREPLGPESQELPLTRAINAAVADISSLRRAGVAVGNRAVLAVLGFDGTPAGSAPVLAADLQQASVVVTLFPAKPRDQRIWQNGLLRAGAERAVVLTRAASVELVPVVTQELGGMATEQRLAEP